LKTREKECEKYFYRGPEDIDMRFAPKASIMHIDIDPAEIGKNINVQYALEETSRKYCSF